MKKALQIIMVLCIGISIAMVGVACKKNREDNSTKSNDATLSALAVTYNGTAGEALSPAFNAAIFDYTLVASKTTTEITIAATKNDSKATIAAGQTGKHTVSAGTKTFEVQVTAEDQTSIRIYKIAVTVPTDRNSDATLDSLSVNNNPVNNFNPMDKDYTFTVSPGTQTVNIGASSTVEDSQIDIKYRLNNGTDGTSSTFSVVQSDDGELNKITITVTALDKTTKAYYTIKIIVPKPSSDTSIKTLTVVVGTTPYTLIPVFYEGSIGPWEVELPKGTKSVTITATASQASAKVSGDTGSKNISNEISIFNIRITAQDNVNYRDYKLTIIVPQPSSEARLGSLGISGRELSSHPFSVSGKLSPAFSSDIEEYTVTMPANTKEIMVSAARLGNLGIDDYGEPKLFPATSTIQAGTGIHWKGTTASQPFMPGDTKDITVGLVAEDGVTKKGYKIKVTIAKGDDATLSELYVSTIGATKVPTLSSGRTYTVEMPAGTKTVTINATATESTTKIDGGTDKLVKRYDVIPGATKDITFQVKPISTTAPAVTYTIKVTVVAGPTFNLGTLTFGGQNFVHTDFNVNSTNYTVNFTSGGTTKIGTAITSAMSGLDLEETVQAIKDAVMYDYRYTILPVFDGSPYYYEAGLNAAYATLKETKGYSSQLIDLMMLLDEDETQAELLIEEFFEDIDTDLLKKGLIEGVIRESVLQRYLYFYLNSLSGTGWKTFANGGDAGLGFTWGANNQTLSADDAMIIFPDIAQFKIKCTFGYTNP